MRARTPRAALAAAALIAAAPLAALAGCGSSQGAPPGGATGSSASSSTSGAAAEDTEVTVLAAASLQEAFTTIGRQVEREHPGTHVRFSFAASSELARQVLAGAPADVLATASPAPMEQVLDAGAATGARTFARNHLEIAVPPDDPAGVRSLADLARPDVQVALCQPQVPCGSLAQQVLQQAGVQVTPVTQEADVKAALTRVRTGEVDAALVYVTDVRSAGDDVRGIDLPVGVDAATDYPIAVLSGTKAPQGARAFADAVLSPEGQRVLAGAGFAAP